MRTALSTRPTGLGGLPALPLWTFVALALACLIPTTASAAPTITGTDEDVWNTARPVPAYVVTRTAPGTQIWWEVAGVASGSGRSPLTVLLPGVGDGSYRLVASEGEGSGQTSAVRLFRVDLTPPRITIRQPTRGAHLEQGAIVLADYGCEGAVSCAGDVAPGLGLDTSRLGPASFSVRAADEAGNVAISVVEYEIRPAGTATPAPSGPPAAGLPSPSAPVTINARRLRPGAGAVLTSKRPVLRWPARRGARLYNLQIFRLRGASITKVVSAFPRLNRFRVPPGAWHSGTATSGACGRFSRAGLRRGRSGSASSTSVAAASNSAPAGRSGTTWGRMSVAGDAEHFAAFVRARRSRPRRAYYDPRRRARDLHGRPGNVPGAMREGA